MESDIAAALKTHYWYHTIDLGNGIVTPGYYDLRPVVGSMPWPDLKGKRCLDVGTFDGFLAFEMEKRGASEVIALDVDDYESLDWPARTRERAPKELAAQIGSERGRGFRIAKEALGSKVERKSLNVYDLSPDRVGQFDLIVCGSILTHLRDPIRALEAMRSVCRGQLLATEGIDMWMTIRHPRLPLIELRGTQDQWYIANAAAVARWIDVAGFNIEHRSRRYAIGYGPGFKQRVGLRGLLGNLRRAGLKTWSKTMARAGMNKVLTGHSGPGHVAFVARPGI